MLKKQDSKIWLSFDLGINGDYEGMYAWLDKQNAEECGDSFAIIRDFQFTGDIAKALLKEIRQHVKLRRRDRIYMICNKPLVAKFIVGGRKNAPWRGYSINNTQEADA
jgi:hypothetical protein